MSKHRSEDYKISAVKYYLNNDVSLDDVCEIFDCPKQSLYRWVKRYNELEEIKRLNRKPKSYKITKEQVKYAIQKLKENERCKLKTLFLICNLLYKKNL
jgi:transposase-like protein